MKRSTICGSIKLEEGCVDPCIELPLQFWRKGLDHHPAEDRGQKRHALQLCGPVLARQYLIPLKDFWHSILSFLAADVLRPL